MRCGSTQTEPESPGCTTDMAGTIDGAGDTDWTGATVRGRDGAKLGTLVEVLPSAGVARGRWGVVRSMLGRRRVVPLDGAADDGTGDLSVPTDRASVRTAPLLDDAAVADAEATGALHRHYTGRGVLADARALQHERYGGSKLGSAFFGWLVAVGLTVLLGVLAGAVTAALGVGGDRTQRARDGRGADRRLLHRRLRRRAARPLRRRAQRLPVVGGRRCSPRWPSP